MNPIKRRSLLQAAGLLLPAAWFSGQKRHPLFATLHDTAQADSSMTRFPASAMHSASGEHNHTPLKVLKGSLPPDLTGRLFIVAPNPPGAGRPIFSGDGLLSRINFDGDLITYSSRIMRTPCYFAEKAAHNSPHSFFKHQLTRFSPTLGVRNLLNTAVIPMGQRLLVTYDAGRPFEISPDTLEVLTPVGHAHEWCQGLPVLARPQTLGFEFPFPLVFSTAHPFYDEHTHQFFSVNFTIRGNETRVICWDGLGRLKYWKLRLKDNSPVGITSGVHQIVVTKDFIIIADSGLTMEWQKLFAEPFVQQQPPNTPLYFIRRADLDEASVDVKCHKLVLPREAPHLFADYNQSGDRLTFSAIHTCATDPSEWILANEPLLKSGYRARPELQGFLTSGTDIGVLGTYTFDLNVGRMVRENLLVDDELTWGLALYSHRSQALGEPLETVFMQSGGFWPDLCAWRLCRAYENYPYRRVLLHDLPILGRPSALMAFTPQSLSFSDRYVFPTDKLGLSPQFIPRPGCRHDRDGFLACVVLGDTGDEFWIFDAANLAQGPLCQLGTPLVDLSFTLHTAWLPPPENQRHERIEWYRVPWQEDIHPPRARFAPGVQELLEASVVPKFT